MNKYWFTGTALINYILILSASVVAVYWPVKNLQDTWLGQHDLYDSSAANARELATEFGYGGFVHHIKNYVLHRQLSDLDHAERSLTQTIRSLDGLNQQLQEVPNLEPYFNDINQVLLQYQTQINWLRSAENYQDKSPVQLDLELRFDDSAAVLRLGRLMEVIKTEHLKARESYQGAFRLFALNFGLVVLTTSGFYWWGFGRLHRVTRLATRQNELLSAITDSTPVALVTVSASGRLLQTNQKFRDMFNLPVDADINDFVIEDFIPKKYQHSHVAQRSEFSKTGGSVDMDDRDGHLYAKKYDGEVFPVGISVKALKETENSPVLSVIQDRSKEQKLNAQALTDFLTGAHNRRGAQSLIDNAVYRLSRHIEPFSVLLLDVDHFKTINDEYGHEGGDQVLVKLVSLFNQNLRHSDHIARWGGDEFVIIMDATDLEMATQMAEKLRRLVENAFSAEPFDVTISIGVTEAQPEQGGDQVLKNADIALYLAKENGRNGYAVVKGDQETIR